MNKTLGKVFVTGGTGFVGSRLIKRLLQLEWDVHALVRNEASARAMKALGVTPVIADMADEKVLTKSMQNCALVFHVAGHLSPWGNYDVFYKTNVVGTRAMLDAAKKADVQTFIAVGAAAVVMNRPTSMRKINEKLPLQYPSWAPYIKTKAEAEKLVIAANTQTMRTVVLRPPMIWGDNMPTLHEMVQIAKDGNFAFPDGGSQEISTCHVDNLISCLILAAEKGKGGDAYFVTDNDTSTLKDVINGLLSTQGVPAIDKKAPFAVAWFMAGILEFAWRLLRRKGNPPITRQTLRMIGQNFSLDITKVKRDLGYSPVVTRSEGLALMTKH